MKTVIDWGYLIAGAAVICLAVLSGQKHELKDEYKELSERYAQTKIELALAKSDLEALRGTTDQGLIASFSERTQYPMCTAGSED